MKNSFLSRRHGAVTAVAAAVALTLAMTGCSDGGSADGSDKKTVGATLLSLQYPFLVKLNEAAKAEAEAQGLELISLDPRQQTSTEMQQVEDLITKQVDLVVMIPVDQKISQAAARRVNEAKIPLLLVNTSFEDFAGEYVSYVGSDDTKAGEIQGQYLVDQLPQGGNVIYLVGQYGGAGTERRKAGFESVIKGNANIKVVTELEAHGSRAEAKTIMEDLLRKYPSGQVQAVIAQSDEMAIGAASAIAEANRQNDFKIVMGVDGSADGLKSVGDGLMTATVFQDAVGQGKTAMEIAKKILDGESVPKTVDLPFKLVTKENLSEFTG
ncbi:sugar ABC transporter substrate-binding protein [Phytohabitans kaempferiae]|uniref:Sugar ABC transporter substrate-binding protein n=1 Tax=Phytohabitans kaempferiae TaxID=1620943 RepID=A0ABV6M2S5_9ACTN